MSKPKITISDVSESKFARIKASLKDLGNGIYVSKGADKKLIDELNKYIRK